MVHCIAIDDPGLFTRVVFVLAFIMTEDPKSNRSLKRRRYFEAFASSGYFLAVGVLLVVFICKN